MEGFDVKQSNKQIYRDISDTGFLKKTTNQTIVIASSKINDFLRVQLNDLQHVLFDKFYFIELMCNESSLLIFISNIIFIFSYNVKYSEKY